VNIGLLHLSLSLHPQPNLPGILFVTQDNASLLELIAVSSNMNPRLETCTLKKLEGREISVGSYLYRLAKLISEKADEVFAERRALSSARRIDNGT
jgi:hypothetical protein